MTSTEAVRAILDAFFDGDTVKVGAWLETPNPNLGGVSPNEMIVNGRVDKLLKWMQSAVLEGKV